MDKKPIFSGAMAVALIATSGTVLAQDRGGGGRAGQQPAVPSVTASGDQDRLQDRSPDRDRDRDQLRDGTGDGTPDRTRDQDRLHTEQSALDQLSGLTLLTSAERAQFREEMQRAKTQQERDAIRARHQATIEQRARDLGVEAPFGSGNGPGVRDRYMMMQLMTEQERMEFHQRMRSAQTAQQREQLRTEMRERMQQRAQELGVNLPAGFGMMSRGQ